MAIGSIDVAVAVLHHGWLADDGRLVWWEMPKKQIRTWRLVGVVVAFIWDIKSNLEKMAGGSDVAKKSQSHSSSSRPFFLGLNSRGADCATPRHPERANDAHALRGARTGGF